MEFKDDAQLTSYVESQAREGLPPGWRLVGGQGPRTWLIVADGKSAQMENFILTVSGDFEWFILYFGNSDAGYGGIHIVALNAKVMTSSSLDHFPLAQAIKYVVTTCKVNTWGLT